MIASVSSILIPLALTAGLETASPTLHHNVKAFVTGYNTIPGQTDMTPCVAASGANICGRHDAVACPRRIGLGTIVEIRGTTYVCEDRLAKKFDTRFDISCDKDTSCPHGVTGWTTVKVYGDERPVPAVVAAKTVAKAQRQPGARLGQGDHVRHAATRVASATKRALKLAASATTITVSVLRGHG